MVLANIFSDSHFLKSDFHGVEIEVTKSRCYSLIGLKGIIFKETFSTFLVCNFADPNFKSKSIQKIY